MLWFLFLLLATATATATNSTHQPPTITECTPALLQLTPCAPYVQGIAASPLQSCCDDLIELYRQQPECLCLIITTPNLGGFPINTTLAMHLPSVCGIRVKDPSTSCFPGSTAPPLRPPHANSSVGSNSTAPSTAVVQIPARPVIMGMGIGWSSRVGVCRQVSMMLLLFCLFQLFLQQ
ncbi:Non-specific lipid transfer protein GPI-anchored 10 [Linum grandiflorum]